MIYLDSDKKKIANACEFHETELLKYVKKRVNECENTQIKNFLKEDILKKILTGRPKKLIQIQMLFFKKTIPGYTYKNWRKYLKIKGKKNKTHEENLIANNYGSIYNDVAKIFNYKDYFSIKETIYSTYILAKKLDINTCVYCNRSYTKTVIKPRKITRPEFDHWFPKGYYPLLALSFYNLIPCCHICNSSVKGTDELNLSKHLHPYIDKPEFYFSYYNKTYDKYCFKIISKPKSKSENTIKAFKLKEIYKMHEDEIRDLRKIKEAYSEAYLEILATQYKGLKISENEIYRLAFGTYKQEQNFDKRPLSKMKRDILIELNIIKK